MKVCPKCDRDYGDEAGFCLIEGTALVDGDVMPTVAIESSAEPTLILPNASAKERSRIPLIIAGVLGMIILVIVSAFLLSRTSQKGNAIRENRNLQKNTASQTPTPRPAS